MSKMSSSHFRGVITNTGKRDFAHLISGTVVIVHPLMMNFWKTLLTVIGLKYEIKSEVNEDVSIWGVYTNKGCKTDEIVQIRKFFRVCLN